MFGKTGVGKSTLVNAIFGESVAATGIGRPVTLGSHLYVHRTGKLGIYDTQGLEVGRDTTKIITELKRFIDNSRAMPFAEQVHLAWYCVRATDRRFEETEAAFIRELAGVGLPVILVMTQVPGRRDAHGQLFLAPDAIELGRQIEGMGLPIHDGRAVMVNALADPFTGVEQHGLLDLLDATFRCAPDEAAEALTAAQKIDPARKAKAAEKAVNAATAAATGAGFTPIPFADAAVLVPDPDRDDGQDRQHLRHPHAARHRGQPGRHDRDHPGGAGGRHRPAQARARGRDDRRRRRSPAASRGRMTYAVGTAWHRVCIGMAEGKYETVSGTLDSETIQRVFNQEVSAIMRSRGFGAKK